MCCGYQIRMFYQYIPPWVVNGLLHMFFHSVSDNLHSYASNISCLISLKTCTAITASKGIRHLVTINTHVPSLYIWLSSMLSLWIYKKHFFRKWGMLVCSGTSLLISSDTPVLLTLFNSQDRVLKAHMNLLTHWGRVTHICVGKLTIIASDNGLSPGRRQAIIWTMEYC